MKYFYSILILSCLIGSCSKETNDGIDQKQHQIDVAKIRSFLVENNIQADSTGSGLYYIVDYTQDTLPNTYPNSNSIITVNYRGYLMSDGKIFDEANNVSFDLSTRKLIQGWLEGIPKFKQGEKGRLFIPSTLAYGSESNARIPANSNLIFEIELTKVQ